MYNSGCLTTSLWLSIIYFRDTRSSYWELQIILYSEPRLCSRISFLNLELTSKYREQPDLLECLANEAFVWIYAFYKMLSTDYSGHFRIIKSLKVVPRENSNPNYRAQNSLTRENVEEVRRRRRSWGGIMFDETILWCVKEVLGWDCESWTVLGIPCPVLSHWRTEQDWSSWLTSARPGLDQASTSRTLLNTGNYYFLFQDFISSPPQWTGLRRSTFQYKNWLQFNIVRSLLVE